MTREVIGLSLDSDFVKELQEECPEDVPFSRYVERILRERKK